MNPTVAPAMAVPTDLPPIRKRRRWLSILLGMVIFVSGLIIGAAGATIGMRNTFLRALHHPEQSAVELADRLRRPLKLDDSQLRQIELIFKKHQARFEQIRIEIQPRVVEELDQVEAEVAAVLNPKQRAEWHKRFAGLRATWIPPLPPHAEGRSMVDGRQPAI